MEQDLATQLLTQMAELQATVDAQNSGWFTLGAAGLGGLFGLFASWIPIAWGERKRRQHDAKTLRSSLIAEISAMAEIIRARGYMKAFREGAAGQRADLSVNVPSDYFTVYKGNTARLGLLEPQEASRIVHLYHLVESVVQDVSPDGVLYSGAGGQEGFQQDLDFLERALDLADQLIDDHAAEQQLQRRGPLSAVKAWFSR